MCPFFVRLSIWDSPNVILQWPVKNNFQNFPKNHRILTFNMSVSGFDKFRWVHMGKNCNLKLTAHFCILTADRSSSPTPPNSFRFGPIQKNYKNSIFANYVLKIFKHKTWSKMKLFVFILLLQLIDARNFAKAKRNIFKIQLKREPRRKRKTVSWKITGYW